LLDRGLVDRDASFAVRRATIAVAAALAVGWTTPTGGMKPADIERPTFRSD
jgi:hypothetical protein